MMITAKIVTLDLSGLNLSQVPVELGQLTLAAACPQQQPVEPGAVELGQLTNLQQLYLDNNQLSQVPVELVS